MAAGGRDLPWPCSLLWHGRWWLRAHTAACRVPPLLANPSCVSLAPLQSQHGATVTLAARGSCPLSQWGPPALHQLFCGGFSIPHSRGCSGLMVELGGTGSAAALAGDGLWCRVSLQQAGWAVGMPCVGMSCMGPWGCPA